VTETALTKSPATNPAAADPAATRLAFIVPETRNGERLDRTIAAEAPDLGQPALSRSRVKALIEQGLVTVANPETTGPDKAAQTIDDPSYRVKPGQEIAVTVPPAENAVPQGQVIPLDIVYEDADLIVLNKPAGMVVHPAPGNPDQTLVNALIAHCGDSLSGIGGVKRPGIVHRIDKDTSGLMVVAKNDQAHQTLSAAFARHDIERSYQCVTWGVPQPREGRIEGNIGRDSHDRKKMAVVKSGGKHAVTHYKVLKPLGDGAALVECRLETGRTHQIRVHLSTLGFGLIGDPVYGRATPARRNRLAPGAREAALAFPRQALHAASLGFRHPRTGEALCWEVPLPPDLARLLARLETPQTPG
jgi:23S rRNA pseudouridine1911/1915/1917 synthase